MRKLLVALIPFLFTFYIEGYLYPPHNEFDPVQGVSQKTARYSLDLGSKIEYRRLFVFGSIHSFYGDTIPSRHYGWSADPLSAQIQWGGGVRISENLMLKITHSEWIPLGENRKGHFSNLIWNGISIRYEFGGGK